MNASQEPLVSESLPSIRSAPARACVPPRAEMASHWRYGLPVATMIMWGSLPVVNKIGLADLEPLSFATWRAIVASALFLLVLPRLIDRAALHTRPTASDLVWLTAVGALQTAAFFYCISEGLRYSSAGVAAVILNVQPIITALLAFFVLGESLPMRSIFGLTIAFLSLPFVTLNKGGLSIDPIGLGLLGAATLSWSISTLLFKRKLASRMPPLVATAAQLWIGTLILAAACGLTEPAQLPAFTMRSAATIFYTAAFGTCVPYALWFVLLQRTSASFLSAFTFLIPIFAAMLGYFALGETLTDLQLIGGAGAIVGVAIIVLPGRARDAL